MKLTAKLIFAFLFISLFSSGALAVFMRVNTDREFDRFINQRYEEELIEQLAEYHQQRNSWSGIEGLFERGRFAHDLRRDLFFAVADERGRVVMAGSGYRLGDVIAAMDLQAGAAIETRGRVVGYLLLKPPARNPLEDDFIRRIGGLIFLSAIGATLLAFILGALLSRTITRPIRELTAATHEIANGNFGGQVTVRAKDEIGELAQSFNKMSADLARLLNLRKQMTADIAHELRTPLSLIIGHAEAVHDGVLPPSAENFEIIREEAERLEKLVDDLRTLSLADAGELSINFQPVDLNQVLADIYSHYVTPFTAKHVTFDLQPAPAPLVVLLDPIRFSQALTNILDNALRYTPEDGRVVVSAVGVDDEIEIAIADNGEGVTPEEAAHLFDRFYRADPARTRDGESGGSGLGLAITKSIIEMHKGKIWAEGVKGKGLRMVIRLKRVEG